MFTVCAGQQLNVSAGYIPTHHRVSLEAPQILLPEIELIPSHFICRVIAGTKFWGDDVLYEYEEGGIETEFSF